jgi:hypothetical protein
MGPVGEHEIGQAELWKGMNFELDSFLGRPCDSTRVCFEHGSVTVVCPSSPTSTVT